MTDQANRLRELMRSRTGKLRPASDAAPRLLVIAGGKGGVGTTTIAVNLSIALAQDGRRTLLVDADSHRAGVAAQCGFSDGYCLSDVLSGSRTLHEAIHRGPAGIQVLPGRWAGAAETDASPRAAERLLGELKGLGQHCDVVLLDVGAAVSAAARSLWRAADEVVIVTSPDNVAVMDAYAAVKTLLDTSDRVRVATLINHAIDTLACHEIHDRLRRACRRFLGIDVHPLGAIPDDPLVRAAAAAMRPVLLHAPTCEAAQRITRLPACLGLSEDSAGKATDCRDVVATHSETLAPAAD